MSNIRNNNPISDGDILKNIAKALNRPIVDFAKELGEKKNTIYQVTGGGNFISTRIKSKILDQYPNVNPDYIETGEGEIILKTPLNSNNEFNEELFMQMSLMNKKLDILSSKFSQLIIALSKK